MKGRREKGRKELGITHLDQINLIDRYNILLVVKGQTEHVFEPLHKTVIRSCYCTMQYVTVQYNAAVPPNQISSVKFSTEPNHHF